MNQKQCVVEVYITTSVTRCFYMSDHMEYNCDIVFCISLNRSMQKTLTLLKRSLFKLDDDISLACEWAHKHIDSVRLKIIGVRSFDVDGAGAYVESRFFHLRFPEERAAAVRYMYGLVADGEDENTDALVALSRAIQTDWVQTGDKRRHVIVMFTDASAHKLENANRSNPYYPQDMPASLEELADIWMTPTSGQQVSKIKLKQPAKRLVVFAPQMYPWPEIYESWNQVVYNPTADTSGLDDVTYEDIINSIVGSV